jgi:hypothetical protein
MARHEPKLWFNSNSELVFACAEYAVKIRRQRGDAKESH